LINFPSIFTIEAAQNGNKNEVSSHNSSDTAPQPQREKRVSQRRNDKDGPKAYYKTDLVNQEQTPQQNEVKNEAANAISQEKTQQRHNRGQQGNRSEKVYQPKSGGSSPSELNGNLPQGSPKENGRTKRNLRKTTSLNKEDGGGKKSYQKKNKDQENQKEGEEEKGGNERFNNSSTSEHKELQRDHRAQQVAEASRLQKAVPSGVVPKEIQEKVKRIQEIIGKDYEFHVVYGVLEEEGYDEEKTISLFLERKNESGQVENKQSSSKNVGSERWTNIVKKGIKGPYNEDSATEEVKGPPQSIKAHQNNKVPPPNSDNNHPKNPPKNPNQTVNHPNNQPQRSSIMDSFVTQQVVQTVDPEEVATSLSSAIANQLRVIQEQTRMLTLMQNELSSITQAGTTEREQLSSEKEMMEQRETQLKQELNEVHRRIQELNQLLEENQKQKAQKINSITSNEMASFLLKPISFIQPVVSAPQQEISSAPNTNQPPPAKTQGKFQQRGRNNFQERTVNNKE